MLIDLDKFKTYNDTYGHLQGDIALQTVANAFNDVIKRRGDYVARWGGEEFIAVLPNTDTKGAYEIAEQLRKHVEEIKIPCKDEFTNMTVSIGVNTLEPGQSATIAEFITGADQALYKAKDEGRNRVCRFGG
jgi:diguanylate cyclase (GGDEF)-like protein